MQQEYWEDILGYEGHYQVSNYGNIRVLNNKDPRSYKIKSCGINYYGYPIVTLSTKGVKKTYLVHRLVASMFISNIDNKPEVNHKNGVRDDNRVCNIEWVTRSENCIHKYRTLKSIHPMKGRLGKANPTSKKIDQFTSAGEFIRTWDSMMDIQRDLGIRVGNIWACCNGRLKHTRGFIWKY